MSELSTAVANLENERDKLVKENNELLIKLDKAKKSKEISDKMFRQKNKQLEKRLNNMRLLCESISCQIYEITQSKIRKVLNDKDISEI